ncbi:alpha/beta hydrolase family protein [Nonomuraea aurantiaca]|uniref:alpha/beta hydrolase family protein n=1 Tax=Nonomuraea aurantiaca TaxID=2878562 RepID=UPI001CD96FA5|nr:alpha/beta hydrolase [Nonomuraea aurantiaca]MCA2223964.1 alpha/beta hydrolase [Nonomuraea aurantiaca]
MKLVVAVIMVLLGIMARPAQAADTIEAHYKVAGPWAVTTADAPGYKLYYPADLGAGGVKHPIITWGNGTNAVPTQYSGLLNQLASWGFAVVASTDTTTGTGSEMIAAAQYLIARNTDSSSVFYGKLDVTKVGAVGHSQGAGGSVNTATKSGGLIDTVVPIALPAPIWVSSGDKFYVDQLTCPVLFVSGANDTLISPNSALQTYYGQVPGAAAKAQLKGADHNTIQGTGGGFLGYVTAWLMYQLQGDTYARGAFAGTTPELNTNAGWQNQVEKNLP